MDLEAVLAGARQGLADLAPPLVDLIGSLPDSAAAVPGLDWTPREVAVHLSFGANLYCELATGTASPLVYESKEQFDPINAANNADIPETDPGKLAALVEDSITRLLEVTAGRRGDQPVVYHSGLDFHLAGAIGVILGESVLHGYDLAVAAGRPWPIDAGHAALVLAGYLPILELCLNRPVVASHTAAYRLELAGAEPITLRFTDGVYSAEPDGSGPADTIISADPATFLLVASRRMSQWQAIALGLLAAGGPRPELALGFGDLIVFP